MHKNIDASIGEAGPRDGPPDEERYRFSSDAGLAKGIPHVAT